MPAMRDAGRDIQPGFYWARRILAFGDLGPYELVKVTSHPDLGATWATPFGGSPVPEWVYQLGQRVEAPRG